MPNLPQMLDELGNSKLKQGFQKIKPRRVRREEARATAKKTKKG